MTIETTEFGSEAMARDAHRRPDHQRALRRFAIAITGLTVVGHGFLGFEQSVAQPLIALATAYPMQIALEWVHARSRGLTPRFQGGMSSLIDFLLPAHIAALAVAMLLYYNDRTWIVAFATAVAIGSKSVFRVPVRGASRHFLNPSNIGISATLMLFPSVGITMPWQWTTELSGLADWAFPVLVFVLGTLLHLKHGHRIFVIVGFLVGFVVQAVARHWLTDAHLYAALAGVTGVPAAIFTFYMAPDPATSPVSHRGQVVFGLSIALVYMALMMMHIAFALFYSLTLVCAARGILMALALDRRPLFVRVMADDSDAFARSHTR